MEIVDTEVPTSWRQIGKVWRCSQQPYRRRAGAAGAALLADHGTRQEIFGGAMGGVAQTLSGQPFDTIKACSPSSAFALCRLASGRRFACRRRPSCTRAAPCSACGARCRRDRSRFTKVPAGRAAGWQGRRPAGRPTATAPELRIKRVLVCAAGTLSPLLATSFYVAVQFGTVESTKRYMRVSARRTLSLRLAHRFHAGRRQDAQAELPGGRVARGTGARKALTTAPEAALLVWDGCGHRQLALCRPGAECHASVVNMRSSRANGSRCARRRSSCASECSCSVTTSRRSSLVRMRTRPPTLARRLASCQFAYHPCDSQGSIDALRKIYAKVQRDSAVEIPSCWRRAGWPSRTFPWLHSHARTREPGLRCVHRAEPASVAAALMVAT
jgi:hypothetical protein